MKLAVACFVPRALARSSLSVYGPAFTVSHRTVKPAFTSPFGRPFTTTSLLLSSSARSPTPKMASSSVAGAAMNGAASSSAPATRDYAAAIDALNTLQSNAATIEAIRKSGGRMNDFAIPEMVEYLQRIGYEPSDLNELNVIHITGTKGKGSTSAFVDSLLRELTPKETEASTSTSAKPRPKQVKVGLYTSPHMTSVRERIRINSLPVSEALFTRYFWEVWDALASNPVRKLDLTPLRPVYFRFLTLLAFHIFMREGVDTVILEVGIGGKYDSTNIVPTPAVAGICQLGLDHTALLGNTVEEIAVQKAGIFKKDAPAVCWINQPGEAIREVKRIAEETGVSELRFVDLHPALTSKKTALTNDTADIELGLPGAHQRTNASLALELVNTFLESEAGQRLFVQKPFRPSSSSDSKSMLTDWQRKGLENARWPGRCQTVPSTQHDNLTWYLDGAHTTDSLGVCMEWFIAATSASQQVKNAKGKAKKVFVFNCTNGRSAHELLSAVLTTIQQKSGPDAANNYFDNVIFTTNITFEGGGWSSELTSKALDDSDLVNLTVQKQLQEEWNKLIPESESNSQVTITKSIQAMHDTVVELAKQNEGDQVDCLVTGSLHLVGGAMAHLQHSGCLDEALVSTLRR